jgi:hypothetical protein
MNIYEGMEVQIDTFLIVELDVGEWSASHPWENSPWHPLNRKLGPSQSWSGGCGENKYFLPLLKT